LTSKIYATKHIKESDYLKYCFSYFLYKFQRTLCYWLWLPRHINKSWININITNNLFIQMKGMRIIYRSCGSVVHVTVRQTYNCFRINPFRFIWVSLGCFNFHDHPCVHYMRMCTALFETSCLKYIKVS
jgi:hypothetical protein